jgi:hypothetical protein
MRNHWTWQLRYQNRQLLIALRSKERMPSIPPTTDPSHKSQSVRWAGMKIVKGLACFPMVGQL